MAEVIFPWSFLFVVKYKYSFYGNFSFIIFLMPAFLGVCSLVFSDFSHNDAKWQYKKCDGARFFYWVNFGQKSPGEIPFYHIPVTSFSFLYTSIKAAHCHFLTLWQFFYFYHQVGPFSIATQYKLRMKLFIFLQC